MLSNIHAKKTQPVATLMHDAIIRTLFTASSLWCCGKFLREILAGNSCGKILWEILAGKSCEKILG